MTTAKDGSLPFPGTMPLLFQQIQTSSRWSQRQKFSDKPPPMDGLWVSPFLAPPFAILFLLIIFIHFVLSFKYFTEVPPGSNMSITRSTFRTIAILARSSNPLTPLLLLASFDIAFTPGRRTSHSHRERLDREGKTSSSLLLLLVLRFLLHAPPMPYFTSVRVPLQLFKVNYPFY